MNIHDDLAGRITAFSIDPVATVTSTSTGSGIDIRDYKGTIKVVLDCGAASAGTNPTVTVKIQDSADNSTFADITGAAFAEVTSTALTAALTIDADNAGRYIRAVATVGGTATPTFAYSVVGIGIKQTG